MRINETALTELVSVWHRLISEHRITSRGVNARANKAANRCPSSGRVACAFGRITRHITEGGAMPGRIKGRHIADLLVEHQDEPQCDRDWSRSRYCASAAPWLRIAAAMEGPAGSSVSDPGRQ